MTQVVQLKPETNNQNTAAIRVVQDRFVIVPTTDNRPKFRDLLNPSMAPQGNPMMLVQAYRDAGGTGAMKGEDLIHKLPIVFGETFRPGDPRRVIVEGSNKLLNLWETPLLQPSGTTVTREQVGPFVDFLARWFPDIEERAYFTRWMAWTVRYPHRRIVATPLLRSEHGTGKGFFVECLMAGLLGKKSVANTSLKSVVGGFGDILEGRTFIVIDELYKSGEATANALKSIQGNATFTLDRKNQPIITIDNYINFIVTTNDLVPLDLEAEDRRFWVPKFIKHKVDDKETAHFINAELRPWLESGGFQVVRDYLEQLDLSDFYQNNPAPMTLSKREIIGLTAKDDLSEFTKEYIANITVLKAIDIEQDYNRQTGTTVSSHAITKELTKLGCKAKRTSFIRWWITPKGLDSGLSDTSTPAELQKAYDA